jgi:hypothetical protein
MAKGLDIDFSLFVVLGERWVEQLGLDESVDFLVRQTFRLKRRHKLLYAMPAEAQSLGAGSDTAAGRNKRPGPVLQLQKPFVLQLRISFSNRVMADHNILGQGADSRHLVAMPKDAGLDRVSDLLHQLQIERLA